MLTRTNLTAFTVRNRIIVINNTFAVISIILLGIVAIVFIVIILRPIIPILLLLSQSPTFPLRNDPQKRLSPVATLKVTNHDLDDMVRRQHLPRLHLQVLADGQLRRLDAPLAGGSVADPFMSVLVYQPAYDVG